MRKIIPLILTATVLLTACHKTPGTTIINNDSDLYAPLETESAIDVDKLPVVTLSEEAVDEVLECGDVTVTLKGTINKPDTLEGLYIYKANIVDYNEYENNMTFLFGEYEDLIHRFEPSKHLGYNAEEQWGYRAYIVNSSLYDENNFTGIWGSIFFFRAGKPLEEKTKVGMTDEEAKIQADEIINKIGLTSFQHYKTIYSEEVLQMTPEGVLGSPFGDKLTVTYAQYLQGIPVLSTCIQREVPHTEVTFDYAGVAGVSIAEYTYEIYSSINQCISYEEALEKFKDTISQDKDSNGLVFDNVKFEYSLTKEYIDGKFEIIAVPCWHFYYEGIPGSAVIGVDVKVNAINGNVTRGGYNGF